MICLFWNIFLPTFCIRFVHGLGIYLQSMARFVGKRDKNISENQGLFGPFGYPLCSFTNLQKGGQWSILFGIHYQKIVLILCCKKLCDESHTIWLFNIAMENHHF